MKVGDKVVIVSRDYEGVEDTHNFNIGQVCKIIDIQEEDLRLEGKNQLGIKLLQWVYIDQVKPYEVKTN